MREFICNSSDEGFGTAHPATSSALLDPFDCRNELGFDIAGAQLGGFRDGQRLSAVGES
jgi:hypothetical protein